MTKQPMTPTGVQDKIDELYLLTDITLEEEAAAIQADFKAWVKANFTLTTKQEDYLDELGTQILGFFGASCSVAFSNRLPIDLIYPAPPTTDYSKYTGCNNALAVKSDGGKPVATGTLSFEITYAAKP